MFETTLTRRLLLRSVAPALLLVLVACGQADVAQNERPVERFEFMSYEDVDPLFEKYEYTPEAWQAGVREIPRIYLTNIPPRWRDSVSSEVSIQAKKRIFFRTLAPLILRANELILVDRERLTSLAKTVAAGDPLAGADRDWLVETAVRYRVAREPESLAADAELAGAVEDILVRMDIVPVSLVLAQSAEESGWGTSRFAAEGNALFGQWTWKGEGITPEGQREGLGDYRIAAFETPLKAVSAYMLNLNTHRAYKELRARRLEMRLAGEKISGRELAKTLTRYSERGEDYVKTLHAIMRVNKLDPTDDAYLGDTPTILLVPVGEGAE